MRISDWSSDVCSSDLAAAIGLAVAALLAFALFAADGRAVSRLLPTGAYDPRNRLGAISATMTLLIVGAGANSFLPYVLRAAHGHSPLVAGYDRKRVVLGKRVSVSVTLGGRRPH